LWLVRLQIGVVYFYGGISKLNDDWLRGEPMRHWLWERSGMPLVGQFFHEEWLVDVLSYGALLLDLSIVPLLLWRRTRLTAFVVAVLFHLMNSLLWTIGIFPWLMIAATTLFFPPDWPRRVFRRVGCAHQSASEPARWWAQPTLLLAALYALIQALVPLTHFCYPGSVLWTGEGHRFGWHMLHRKMDGVVLFDVRDPTTGNAVEVDPTTYLAPHQYRQLPGRPDMLLQFAQHLADEMSPPGGPRFEVRVRTLVSLNGRKPQPIVDPEYNLAAAPRNLRHKTWILPLTEPLP